MVTIVLLKEAWICAIPLWTVLRSFFFPFFTLMNGPSYSGPERLRARGSWAGCWFPRCPDGSPFAFPGSGIGPRALSPDRQPLAMSQPAIGARVDQSLDIHGDLFPEVPFHFIIAFDDLTQFDDLILLEIFHARRRSDSGLLHNLSRARPADPVDIRQADVHALVSRSEEHTSELQSPYDLVCRLLLEKKNKQKRQKKSKKK